MVNIYVLIHPGQKFNSTSEDILHKIASKTPTKVYSDHSSLKNIL